MFAMKQSTTNTAKRASAAGRRQRTKTIKQKEFISAPPGEIYDALLNEKTHAEFTGAKATCERFVGGKFSAWNGYITGTNVKLESARRIVQEWRTSEWPEGFGPSLLEFQFQPKGNGTEVRLVQSNVPAMQAKFYKKGWAEFYWKPLRKFFRKH